MTSTVREWKRRDWGEGGFEFHWWCTDSPDAFVAKEPVYITLADELVETVGEDVYKALVEHLDERRRRKTLPPPPPGTPLTRETPPILLAQHPLADADRIRSDFDELVVGDELDAGLEGVHDGRGELDRVVGGVGANVGLLLLTRDVDHHVAGS